MTDPVAEPLTALIAALKREFDEAIALDAGFSREVPESWWRDRATSLLATLDAARAAGPEPGVRASLTRSVKFGPAEARQQLRDLATLRCSLPAIVGPETAELWVAFGHIERALGHAARGAGAEPGLDVDAVAFALHRLLNHGNHGGGWDEGDGDLAYSFMDHYEHAPSRSAGDDPVIEYADDEYNGRIPWR
jgi:hypothetical protein